MERSKSFRTKTLRLHPLENAIFDRACEALNGMERTQLMQEAIISEASRLGIRWTAEPPPPLTTPWRYLPDRGDDPTGVRVSITHTAGSLFLMAGVPLEVVQRMLRHTDPKITSGVYGHLLLSSSARPSAGPASCRRSSSRARPRPYHRRSRSGRTPRPPAC